MSQDEKWGRGTESNFIQITIFCSAKPRVDAFVTALFKNTWILKLKKPAAVLLFSLLSIISADLLGNRILLWRVQKVTVCDWRISIRLVCFSVSRFVACDHDGNYDWRKQKTHLWRLLLNFRVRVFLKSAVRGMRQRYFSELRYIWGRFAVVLRGPITHPLTYLKVWISPLII